MEQPGKEQAERAINHFLKDMFPAGTVQRAVLLEHGDDPAIGPGQLMIRVFIPVPDDQADYERALPAWQELNRTGMDEARRTLSARLPSARLLEFTFDAPGVAVPRLTLEDDGTAEHVSGREIVTTAMSLLRDNYVFPEVADQAAAAVEARLAAGEYDDLDEITLTDLVTGHLRELTGDKHLALRLGGGPPPDRGPGPGPGPGPGSPGPRVPGSPGPRVPGNHETTGCGAHPTRGFPVSGAVHMGIPFARAVNPVTGTNWEGTGVTPDVAVPEAEAYDVAYAKALRHVVAQDDVPAPIKHEAREALTRLEYGEG